MSCEKQQASLEQVLFSTLVTYAEFLDWGTESGFQVKDALAHHAYVEFRKIDPEMGMYWRFCWRAEVVPELGGYRVTIFPNTYRGEGTRDELGQ